MKKNYLTFKTGILILILVIPCGVLAQFSGTYAPANWTMTNNPATNGGSVNSSGAPASISITSGNVGVTNGRVLYTVTVPCSGTITFNWSYFTTDVGGSSYDRPEYSINGGPPVNMPGFVSGGPVSQTGTASIPVAAGSTFSLIMLATDGILGSATTTFSNWVGPVCTPCTGTPNATAVSTSTSVCPSSSSFTLSLTGLPVVTGLTYQWQSSPPCANTFTNLPAPSNNATYSVSNLTTSTDYRAIVTCTNSGLSFTTNIISVTAMPNCYCASTPTGFQNTDIGQVTVGTYSNPAAPPPSLVQPGATQTYTSFLNAAPITLATGNTYPLAVTQVNTSTTYNVSYLKAYIDYNQNGLFTDPGEEVFSQAGPATSVYNGFSGNFTVPATATLGYTRMRFVLWQGGNSSTVLPCSPSPPTAYSFGETEDYRVLIQAAPNATSNSPVCAGNPLNLNSNVSSTCATHSWTGPGGFTSTVPNPVIATANLANAGVYTVSVTSFGVTTTSSTTVVVNPAVTSAINASICSGGSYTLGTQVLTTSGTYSQLFQTSQGCDSNVTLNLTVSPLPSPPVVSSPVNYCQGATATALTATGTNLLWYTTATGGVGSATAPVPSTATLGATTYYVSQTVNNCESLRDSITVIITAPPPVGTLTSTNPTTCNGTDGTITITGLTANTSYTINYSQNGVPQASLVLSSGAGGSVTLGGLSAGTYNNFTVTANSCTASVLGTATLTNPVAPATPTAGGNSPLCAGGTLNLTSSTIPGATYAWTGPNGFTSTTQNPVIAGVTTAASGNYFVTATVNGCTSSPGTVTITVNPIPAIPTVSSNSPVCAGTALNLSTPAVTGATYNWTGPAFTAATQNPVINNAQTGNSGVYSVTVTVNGCASPAATTSVIVNPLPVIGGTSSSNPSTCAGTDGSITLIGLQSNTTYTVNYLKNNIPATPLTSTSSGAGSIVINGLSAGTYTAINISIANCTSLNVGPLTLADPAAPSTPVAGSNSPVCGGNSINLTASGIAGATYSWTGPGGFNSSLQNPVVTNALPVNAGVYSVTATLNNCTSSPATTTVIVTPPPVISSTSFSNPTGCNGTDGSITLSGLSNSVAYIVSYTKNSVAQAPVSIISGSTGTVVISGLSAGTYTNIQVMLSGCLSNVIGPITLSDPGSPTSPTVANNGPLCSGATLNLTASAIPGATYSWTGPSFTSTLQNPVIPNVTTANGGAYSVTVTLNNCVSIPAVTTVVINPTPVIIAGGNTPLCEGANLALTATGISGAIYSWVGPGGFTSTSQNPTIPGVTVVATGTYSATASLNGCVGTSSLSVVVNPTPAAPAVANIDYCQSAAAAPLTATGQNLLWYTNATGGTGTALAPTPSTSNPGTFTWYVSQTVTGCESPRVPITVTIIPKPLPPAVTAALSYCQNAPPVQLTAAGQNLLWYANPTGGTGFPTAPTPSTANAGVFTWYVSQTVGGCESNRASISVTVYATPPPPQVTTPVLFCIGEPASALTAQGQNLLWYPSATGGIGSAVAPVPSTTVLGSTNFYVTQTVNGCESNRSVITVTISDKVAIGLTLSSDTICQYETILIGDSVSNPATAIYKWNFDGGIIVSGSGGGPYSVKWNNTGAKTVTVSVVNGNCSATDTRQVVVKPSPVASFVLDADACLDEQVNIQAAWGHLDNSAYKWDFGGATVISGSGPGAYKVKWLQPGLKVVTLITEENGCQSEPFHDTIEIHEYPIAKIEAERSSNLCAGDVIKVQAVENPANNAHAYMWSPKEYFTYLGAQSTEATIKATGYVRLQVTDEFGCSSYDSIYIETKPCCDVYLPDAFTPNGDGRNDVFRLITIGHHMLSSFRIVNRWGQTIFEGGDSEAAWDGSFKGVAQPMGTYFYYLKYHCSTGEVIEKKGELTLIR